MSVRHQYSYWLTIMPIPGRPSPSLETVLKDMKDNDLLYKSKSAGTYLVATIDEKENTLSAEVNPYWGTVEEDRDLLPQIEKLAARFPDFHITLEELDEEDKSQQRRTVFINGKLYKQHYLRSIPLGNEYDTQTVSAIFSWLQKQGCHDIANKIHSKFYGK